MSPGPPALAGLIGAPASEARERLGDPAASRPARPGRWLVWKGEGWRLRIRTGGGAEPDPAPGAAAPDDGPGGTAVPPGDAGPVTSWILTWEQGRPTLRGAVEPLGLWPAAAPDAVAPELGAPLARRALEGPDGRVDRSLTVTVRRGSFVRVAVFDEAPEW